VVARGWAATQGRPYTKQLSYAQFLDRHGSSVRCAHVCLSARLFPCAWRTLLNVGTVEQVYKSCGVRFRTQSLWIWGVQNRPARPSTSLRTGSGGHPGGASSGLRLFCLDSRVRGNDAALINPSQSSWQTTSRHPQWRGGVSCWAATQWGRRISPYEWL